MLTRPRRHLDDRECCCSAQVAPPGIRADGGKGLKLQPGKSREISEVGGDRGSAESGRVRRHFSPLTPVTAPLVPVQEDVEHGPVGEGGAVLDGLHPGDRLLSLQ